MPITFPPTLVKTSHKKMTATPCRKFCESSGPLGQTSGSTTAGCQPKWGGGAPTIDAALRSEDV